MRAPRAALAGAPRPLPVIAIGVRAAGPESGVFCRARHRNREAGRVPGESEIRTSNRYTIEAGALPAAGMNKYRTAAGGWRLLRGVAAGDGDKRWLYGAQGRASDNL